MLEARNVTVLANGNTLLRQVTIAAKPGRILVLIGPNGAGKSTLLRVLSGELLPTQGDAFLDGRRLATYPSAELSRRRAVVPQASMLAFPFTVLEVAMLGITVPGFAASSTAATEAGLEALEAVGLSALADRLYVHLSGGERQRVHIARALCQLSLPTFHAGESRCLLLDEPTSNLDLAHQGLVLAAVRNQAERGCAVLAVMHDLNLAAALADDMVLLVRGQVAAAGPGGEVLQDGLLSAAFGCEVFANRTPGWDCPFVLPPAVFLPQRSIGTHPATAPASPFSPTRAPPGLG
jgi:iron complex transport system ATP-binding protein